MRIIGKLGSQPLTRCLLICLVLLGGFLTLKPSHVAADCGDPSTHLFTTYVQAFDVDTGAGIPGAVVRSSRALASCPNINGKYIDDSGQPGHGPNIGTTDNNGLIFFYDNCNQVQPYMTQVPPPGYTFDHANFISGGNTIRVNSGTQSAFQGAINSLWNPSLINDGAGIIMQVYYKAQITWQLAPGDSGGGSVTSVSTPLSFSHQIWDIGPSRANFKWYLQQNYNGGSFTTSNIGPVSGAINGTVTNGPINDPPDVDVSYTYHFPSGAKSGDKYCQRTAFSNPNGPGTSSGSTPDGSWGYGNTICATYNPGGSCTGCSPTCTDCPSGCSSSGCPADVICTEDLHTLTPHANYRFTLFDSGGGSGYVTGTPVPVSPSGGDYNSGNYPSMGGWATLAGGAQQQAYPTNGSGNPSVYTFTYPATPAGPDAYTVVEAWIHDPSAGTWHYSYKVEGVSNCYSATCSISVDGNVPGGGAGDVQAGSGYSATATITNTGIEPLQGIDWAGNADANGNPSQALAIGGGTGPQLVDMNPPPNAPATIGSYTLGGGVYYAAYEVAGCSTAAVNVYQHFTLVPGAGISSTTSPENPTSVTYNTSVTYGPDPYTDPYPGPVNSNTNSILNYVPRGGGATTVDNVPVSGSYNNASYSNTYNGPDSLHYRGEGGDQFCPVMAIDNATGWIGPGGSELDKASATSNAGCMTVENRPFFKTFNGGISSGGGFKATNPSGSGGGELAGWNNDTGTYPSLTSGDYGSSAQLNALALINIVGFASGQGYSPPSFGASPTNLTFANNPTNVSGDSYSPSLDGAFDPTGGGYYLNDQTAPTSGDVTNAPGPQTPLPAMTINPGDNKSIFATGDVYISGNIMYNTSGWSYNVGNSNIPSFVLHATGNIYISRGVTQLDGVYIARGEIYTCSDDIDGLPYKAMPANELFDNCKQQLTVNGSFVAGQVNMMRTFGSLRDETPVSTSMTPAPGPQIGFAWTSSGGTPGSSCGTSSTPVCGIPGMQCNHFSEGGAPGSSTWEDNYLCVPASSPETVCYEEGTPYGCTGCNFQQIDPSSSPYYSAMPGYWQDNAICPNNYSIGFSWGSPPLGWSFPPNLPNDWHIDPANGEKYAAVYETSTRYCTLLYEDADPTTASNGDLVWEHTYICESLAPTIPQPSHFEAPSPLSCTNNGGGWISTQTCAAEVFNFSPELYLSSPNVAPPSNGAPEWDAVTGLPPVL